MRHALLPALVALLLVAAPQPASAEPQPGQVILSTIYPAVVSDRGRDITLSIDVVNLTQAFQEVVLQVAEGPSDWQPALRDRGFTIRNVMVGPGKTQTVEFFAKPPAAARPQEYAFLLRALNTSGVVVSQLRIAVTLREQASAGLKLTTQFPNVRGQAGSTFSFKLDLENAAAADRDVTLTADPPQGWETVFRPSFESKQVSTFRMKGGSTQGVDAEITPPQRSEAGEYKIAVVATSGADRAEAVLNVVIVGQSRLSLATPLNQPLSTKASPDSDTRFTLVVKNTGTTALRNVTFSSSRPDGWNVTFQPERVDELAPNQESQVNAVIRPSSRALAGDYLVSFTASAQATSDTKEIRVTVETPTAWGILAVAAMVAVVGGLFWVFQRYSRR